MMITISRLCSSFASFILVYDTWDKSKVSVFSKPTRPSMSETSLADAEDETWNEEYDKPKVRLCACILSVSLHAVRFSL